MPIFEYTCLDCGAQLEFVVTGEEPKVCGRKCTIGPKVKVYGGGRLDRRLSLTAAVGSSASSLKDHPGPAQAGAAGFASYQNEGNGTFRKVSGKGPEVLRRDGES